MELVSRVTSVKVEIDALARATTAEASEAAQLTAAITQCADEEAQLEKGVTALTYQACTFQTTLEGWKCTFRLCQNRKEHNELQGLKASVAAVR